MHAQRIQAIFEKDIKDFMKNMMLSTMPTLPIIIALIFSISGKELEELPLAVLYLIVGTVFSAVTSTCIDYDGRRK
ncbi:hypothetical protein [Virgibacillus siamensis]|uniref:hypothetical protein n=1 Tax=Virgibacillus siamensis TaxID=480071 RepID=UPI001FE753D8|nr:hypothetical protein [Virgibacillus siamensis]